LNRRQAFSGAGATLIAAAASRVAAGTAGPKTIVVVHGASTGGWAWKKMPPLLASAGHRLLAPTLTGLGERSHLAAPSNDLDTHIEDVVNVLRWEDLRDVVLVGHSYGGAVATGVADRARDRVAQLIYLDAFVPREGQAVGDLVPNGVAALQASAKALDGWRVPPRPIQPDTSDADRRWIHERLVPQSLKCFTTPLRLRGGEVSVPRAFIYCKRFTGPDNFGPFAARARTEKGWRYHELDATHSPHITAPGQLAALLMKLVASNITESL
jgi:pimeloyl-ACP methyl ester carboxylesterase